MSYQPPTGSNDPTYQTPQEQPYTQYPQTPYPPPSYAPPPPPKKKRRTWLWIIVGIVALIIFYQIGNAALSQTSSNTTPQATQAPTGSTPSSTQAPTSTPTPAPSFATFGDGTYQVGKDIKPGTYRTRTGSTNCYYARLKGFSGSLGDILANNNTDAPAVVTIKPSDKGFESQNCGTWTQDLSRITASKTSFDDGIFIVGTDITPGTYKDTGGDNCYYARLSGFSGSLSEILANNNVSAPTIVTIKASDKGFESKGCGTWTKR